MKCHNDIGGHVPVLILKSFEEARDLALTLSAGAYLTSVVDTVTAKLEDPEGMVEIWVFRDGRELTAADIEALQKDAPPCDA